MPATWTMSVNELTCPRKNTWLRTDWTRTLRSLRTTRSKRKIEREITGHMIDISHMPQIRKANWSISRAAAWETNNVSKNNKLPSHRYLPWPRGVEKRRIIHFLCLLWDVSWLKQFKLDNTTESLQKVLQTCFYYKRHIKRTHLRIEHICRNKHNLIFDWKCKML